MTAPYRWRISVWAGNYYPDLCQSFAGGDVFLRVDDDEMGIEFYAYSRHVENLIDPMQVAHRLYSLQLLLNGAIRLSWSDMPAKGITFPRFVDVSRGTWHDVYTDGIEETPFDLDLDEALDLYKNSGKVRFHWRLLTLSKSDKALRSILFLVGLISMNSPLENILTWSTLYKILESVKHHTQSLKVDFSSLADTKKMEEFSAACNNMSILGIYSRHGASGRMPPKRIITDLSEATTLILSMAANFCRAYVAEKHTE